MKQKITLTSQQNFRQVQAAWKPAAMAIMNNTPFSLLIRDGSQERPTIQRYDYLIPPGMYTTLPVIAHEFGFALDNDYPGAPSYSQPCTIILIDAIEALPDFGGSSYRLSLHEEFVLARPGNHDIVLDCRTARAALVSLHATPDSYGTAGWLFWTHGHMAVYTASEPGDLFGPAARLVRLVSFPRSVDAVQAVIPLAANYVRLAFVNPAVSPCQFLDLVVDVALMDEVPSIHYDRVSEYHWTEDVYSSPMVGAVIIETQLCGTLAELEIAVQPAPTPTDTFDLTLYLHSDDYNATPGGVGTEIGRITISDFEAVSIGAGLNALPQRHAYTLLGRDPITGAVSWRFELDRSIPRLFRLVMDLNSGKLLPIHFGALFHFEV